MGEQQRDLNAKGSPIHSLSNLKQSFDLSRIENGKNNIGPA